MRRIPRISTFTLIAAFAFTAAALPLAAVLPGLLAAARTEGDLRATETLTIIARQAASRLGNGLARQWRDQEVLVRIAMTEGIDGNFALRLDTAKALNAGLAWMGVAAPDGRVLTATDQVLLGSDVSARPWFRAGLQGAFAGDLHEATLLARFLPSAPGGEPTHLIDFAGPVRRADGSVLAVLGSHVQWSWVREIMRDTPASQRTEAMLISRDGIVLAGPPALEGRRLGLRAVLSAQQGVSAAGVESWEDGISYVTVAQPIVLGEGTPGFGWSVVVRQAPVSILRRASAIGKAVATPLTIAAAIILAGGILLARAIARPLVQLADGAAAIAENRSNGPIPDPRTTRELALLANALARLDRSSPPAVRPLQIAA